LCVAMEIIKDTITSVMKEWRSGKQQLLRDNPQVWLEQVLKKKERAHAKVNYFRRGVLSIKVDSSAWLYQLNLQKEDLLAHLRQQSSTIKDIHFCIGE
jgi:predicted nucleic acid-binding Zn ribbon protein